MPSHKSHKWEIYWVKENLIKTYPNISDSKYRPLIIISSSSKLSNRWLAIECSSHKMDDNSIFLKKYIDKKGKEKENWALPNRSQIIFPFWCTEKHFFGNVKIELRNAIQSKFNELHCNELVEGNETLKEENIRLQKQLAESSENKQEVENTEGNKQSTTEREKELLEENKNLKEQNQFLEQENKNLRYQNKSLLEKEKLLDDDLEKQLDNKHEK